MNIIVAVVFVFFICLTYLIAYWHGKGAEEKRWRARLEAQRLGIVRTTQPDPYPSGLMGPPARVSQATFRRGRWSGGEVVPSKDDSKE